jgi:uncharacterized membrane protein YkvA (DUF1232 family)
MKNDDFYHKLRKKVTDYLQRNEKNNLWTKYFLLAPDFFYLLTKLFTDERVSSKTKFKIGLAITYFINPLDLIPDIFIPVGFLDDIVVTCYILKSVLDQVNSELLNEHWSAKRNVVEVIEEINKVGDKIIGRDLFKKVVAMFKEES